MVNLKTSIFFVYGLCTPYKILSICNTIKILNIFFLFLLTYIIQLCYCDCTMNNFMNLQYIFQLSKDNEIEVVDHFSDISVKM